MQHDIRDTKLSEPAAAYGPVLRQDFAGPVSLTSCGNHIINSWMHLLPMIAMLLGAGFSKWSANLPLTSELFDFSIKPFGIREERKLQRVQRLKEKWNSERPNWSPEEFISDILASFDDRNKKDVLWYIVRRLSDPYIWREWHAGRWRRHVLMIDENRKLGRPGVQVAQDFISKCLIHLCGIVTPNYDLLIEYALGTKRFNYGQPGEVLAGRGPYPVSQWRNPVRVIGAIPVAKLHGSISWDANGRYTDGRRGLTGNALIVAPTPEKRPPSELTFEWIVSGRILQEASRLLVFGFAFNPYDEALLEHLSKYGKGIRDVALVDIRPPSKQAESLWPKTHIECFCPPPEDDGQLRSWLGDMNI